MTEEIRQENKMGTVPVNRLLLSMAIPMIISMLVQALYNVVDSIFVARVSENALTAVSLAFPMQNLMIAVASGMGVGVNALLSRSLGEKNFDRANKAALNGLLLSFIGFVLFLLVGLFGAHAFMAAQIDIEEIVTYGTQYVQICTIFSFGMFFQIMLERLLTSTGRTIYTMITQSTGAVINIVLDYILIFGHFGFPRLEVRGAAIATVIGQTAAAVFAFVLNKKVNRDISLHVKGFRPEKRILGHILAVGIPSMVMMSIGSVMTFCMNKILAVFSSTAVAVFGVYFKLQSFVIMPVIGLNNGMVPIVAYNYGARKRKRITKTIQYSVFYAVGIMLLGLFIIQANPEGLMRLFEASEDMMGIGVPALRIVSLNFIFAGICIILSSSFQALGNGILSMFVSILRQVVVLIPVAYLLFKLGNVDLVWWAFPIAEIASLVFCLLFYRRMYRKIIRPLPEEGETL